MKIGLLGKPSAGKSTFFKAATMADVAIANYPFTTIKPNFGTAYVRVECVDKEFGKQCNPRFGYCKEHTRFVPVELVDVAGLVPGAASGEGMGNQFLSDLSTADVLIHVVDMSGTTNEKGEQTENYDPANDIRFLENEINLWYLSIMERGWDKIARTCKMQKRDIYEEMASHLSSFRLSKNVAQEAVLAVGLDHELFDKWTHEDMAKLANELRRRTKPIIIAGNKMDLPKSEENFNRIKKEFSDYHCVACAGDLEVALRGAAKAGLVDYVSGGKTFKVTGNLNDAQKKAIEKLEKFLEKFGTTGVQDTLDSAIFKFLKYVAVFPGGVNNLTDSKGNTLPDCFLMPPNSTAVDFAYRIHTDIGKAFLYAIDVKTKQRISRDYILKNRDVVEIVSAAK